MDESNLRMVILTTLFFFFSSFLLMFGFYIYAKTLLYLAKVGPIARFLGGLVIYILFGGCITLLPYIVALDIGEWRNAFKLNYLYEIYFLALYIFYLAAGFYYFVKYHLDELRAAGYYDKPTR